MITLIPPTGGRPDGRALADRWMQEQTGQDFKGVVLDDCDPETPKPERADQIIRPNWRWQEGDNTQHASMLALLEQAGDKVIIVEDDDYYSPEYIELMADALTRHDLVGECNALYYHVGMRHWRDMNNQHHASLCSTAVKGAARQQLVNVCKQGHRMIDITLWRSLPGKLFNSRFSVGIKGLPGRGGIGVGHRLRGGVPDPSLYKLNETIGKQHARAYASYCQAKAA